MRIYGSRRSRLHCMLVEKCRFQVKRCRFCCSPVNWNVQSYFSSRYLAKREQNNCSSHVSEMVVETWSAICCSIQNFDSLTWQTVIISLSVPFIYLLRVCQRADYGRLFWATIAFTCTCSPSKIGKILHCSMASVPSVCITLWRTFKPIPWL